MLETGNLKNSHHFDLKLAPKFFDAKLIRVSFPYKRAEGLTYAVSRLRNLVACSVLVVLLMVK
jgi:hypothetical protein